MKKKFLESWIVVIFTIQRSVALCCLCCLFVCFAFVCPLQPSAFRNNAQERLPKSVVGVNLLNFHRNWLRHDRVTNVQSLQFYNTAFTFVKRKREVVLLFPMEELAWICQGMAPASSWVHRTAITNLASKRGDYGQFFKCTLDFTLRLLWGRPHQWKDY